MKEEKDLTIHNQGIIEPRIQPLENENNYWKMSEETKNKIIEMIVKGRTFTEIEAVTGISIESLSAVVQQKEEDIRNKEKVRDLLFIGNYGDKINEIISAIDKSKLDKASLRDTAIAIGILQDKRRDLLGPNKTGGGISLKFAFKDGAGALELNTNNE